MISLRIRIFVSEEFFLGFFPVFQAFPPLPPVSVFQAFSPLPVLSAFQAFSPLPEKPAAPVPDAEAPFLRLRPCCSPLNSFSCIRGLLLGFHSQYAFLFTNPFTKVRIMILKSKPMVQFSM